MDFQPSVAGTEQVEEVDPTGTGGLDGVNVVRVGDSLAGDLLCSLLAEHGATIEQYERADDGGVMSSTRAASVFIDDSGRGALAAAGLDRQRLRQLSPSLVVCTLVGLPQSAPREWDVLEDDVVSAVLGLNRLSGEPLVREPLPVASFYGALLAAVYISAALVSENPRPDASDIEVSLAAAALTAFSRDFISLEDPRLVDIAAVPHLPHVQLYRCADGRYFQPHGLYDKFVRVLCSVAGRASWTEDAVAASHGLPNRAAEEYWRQRLRGLFAERPALEWETAIAAAGGAGTMVRTHEEWCQEARTAAADIVRQSTKEQLPGVGPAVRVDQHDPADAAPTDDHPRARRVVPPRTTVGGLPLSGVRVIDFCIVLAGPTCARILADLGAEVIKIDDPARAISPYPWLEVNRNKRSTVIDLRTPDGVQLAQRLVQSADVVVQNFRSGKIDRLGFGSRQVASARPDLVFASLNAFDFDGAWEQRPGWEHNAQAASGMQDARKLGAEPRQVPLPVNDYATGLLGAFGVLGAIRRRRRTGIGSHVRASLVRSATRLQREAIRWMDDPRRRTYRPVECTDGWIWIREPDDAAASSCAGDLSAMTTREAVTMLRAEGGFAVPELGLAHPDVRRWFSSEGHITRWEHPRLGWIEQVTARPVADGLHLPAGRPADEPGDSTADVLRQLHVTDEEVGALTARGVVHTRMSFFPDVELD